MKEENVKHVRDGVIISPSVSGNTEDESDFQRINCKAIKIGSRLKRFQPINIKFLEP